MDRVISFFSQHSLKLGILCVVVLFLFFFPPFFVSIDEHQYISNALLLQENNLKDANPLLYCGGIVSGEDYLSSYHIGKSFSIIPFTWFPFPFIMLSGLLIHLLNSFFFFLILGKIKIDRRWTLLFLFYPAFLWESRTLFSETFALSFLLAGAYFYLARSPSRMVVAGFLFGLAALVRYETVLISLGFALALFWNTRKDRFHWKHRFVFFAVGGCVAGLLLLGWNAWYYGNPFSTQFGSPARLFTSFPQPLFLNNLISFVGILLIAYPLLLVSPFRSHVLRLELILASVFTLFLFSQTTNISVYPFLSPLTITGRMRYFIPLSGLLLIVYAESLSRLIPAVTKKLGSANFSRMGTGILLLFVAGILALNVMHQGLLEKRATVSDQIQGAIPSDALVIGSSDDCIYFLPLLSGDRKYVKVDDAMKDIPLLIEMHEGPVFVMRLRYSNLSESSIRQDVIDKERESMDAFILANDSHLSPVFDSNSPHSLTIYAWK
ncbi:MAG: hypothetical protein V1776_02725 [Candidatus Diapherotrites archaeon]